MSVFPCVVFSSLYIIVDKEGNSIRKHLKQSNRELVLITAAFPHFPESRQAQDDLEKRFYNLDPVVQRADNFTQ